MSDSHSSTHAERFSLGRSTGGPVACCPADADAEAFRPAFYVLDEPALSLPAPTPAKEV